MFKLAEKIKKQASGLLLFSFLNVLTFLPGSHQELINEGLFHSSGVITASDEEVNRSTVLELILENVAGLEDCLPESEKPDFSYDYFSVKFRNISAFLLDLISPLPQQELPKMPLLAEKTQLKVEPTLELPQLQYHSFAFRLTPF